MTILHFAIASIVYFGLSIPIWIQMHSIRKKPKKWYKDVVIFENDNKKDLKFLYEKAQDMLIHYDNLNWQIGSILVGSNLVAMSFALQLNVSPVLALSLAISGIISQLMWLSWFYRHMALYNLRNDVLYKIEEKLGMHHHRLPGEEGKRWIGPIPGNLCTVVLTYGLSTVWLLMTLFI